jgi:hypothetical protein
MSVDQLRENIARAFEAIRSEADAKTGRAELDAILAEQRKGWSDLTVVIKSVPATNWPDDAKLRERLAKLVARLGDQNEGEWRHARMMILNLLDKYKRDWSVIPELIRAAPFTGWADDAATTDDAPIDVHDLLDVVVSLITQYVILEEAHQYVIVAAWVIATYVYDRFEHAPQLLLSSPVPGCGKTELLKLLKRLVANPFMTSNITAAALRRAIEANHPTMLLDEAKHLDIFNNSAMQAILNAAHQSEGTSVIYDAAIHANREFSAFTPIAYCRRGTVAIFGQETIERSLVIEMHRHDNRGLKRLKKDDQFPNVYALLLRFARTAKLNLDPELPEQLRGRVADNARPLVSVADAVGDEPGYGRPTVREALVILAGKSRDEDPVVQLLIDIRTIFDRLGVDRIASERKKDDPRPSLIRELLALDDGLWDEYRGSDGKQRPHGLTARELGGLLRRSFRIGPRTIRFSPGPDGTNKGFMRGWFEDAWARYCDAGQPARAAGASNVRRLRNR